MTTVEGGEAAGARVGEHRVAERVAALDDEVLDAVQKRFMRATAEVVRFFSWP
jgi:hypothetical protein